MKRYSFLYFVLIILSLFLPIQTDAQDSKKDLKIITVNYPPLMSKKEGLMNEIVYEAFKAKNIQIKFEVYPMTRIIWALKKNKADAVLGSIDWFHKSNASENTHPVKIYSTNMHFFFLKKQFPNGLKYNHLEELKKHNIGYILGGSLIPIFHKAKLQPELVPSLDLNIKKLYAKRIEMIAATELGGWAALAKIYPDSISDFAQSEKPLLTISGDLIFKDSNHKLIKLFKEGMNIIAENGTYLKLYRKINKNKKTPEKMIKFINDLKKQSLKEQD